MTEELSRASELASRHTALGSGLEDWNGMGTAWTYDTNPNDEHDAVRTAAGLFDMSPLKKVHVRGADATKVVDYMITRDMSKIPPGKSAYGAILTEGGTVSDDAIIANIDNDHWLYCHGSGGSMELLEETAKSMNASVEFDDDLHNIAVQGPVAQQLLSPHTNINLADMNYFHHDAATLFGHDCRISRTGYSGEQGYEIFANRDVVADIWDNLVGHGKDHGVIPCSFTALDKVRIEAALLFYGYDMTDEHFPTEVGLGFTVAKNKAEYRGKQASLAAAGQERFKAAGIVVEHTDMIEGGETLMHDNKEVGIVNSPCWSHRTQQSLALVHLKPEACAEGTQLSVVAGDKTYHAKVSKVPFYDPEKTRAKT